MLRSNYHARYADTIVMSNYGYFQLKAAPGLWKIAIAPGRSNQLYFVSSSSISSLDSESVVLSSFNGAFVRLKLRN